MKRMNLVNVSSEIASLYIIVDVHAIYQMEFKAREYTFILSPSMIESYTVPQHTKDSSVCNVVMFLNNNFTFQ
jgi:hypothetical protein